MKDVRAESCIVLLAASLQPLELQSTNTESIVLVQVHLELSTLALEVDSAAFVTCVADVQLLCNSSELSQ